MPTSIFSDEWRECLVAHYTSVLRAEDKKTERTLRGVMVEAGFTDGELREITVMATAHVDNVSADFVPDMDILAPVMVAVSMPEALEAPLDITEAIAEVEALAEEATAQPQEVLEALAQPVSEAETEPEQEAEPDSETDEPPDDPGIVQLSLF